MAALPSQRYPLRHRYAVHTYLKGYSICLKTLNVVVEHVKASLHTGPVINEHLPYPVCPDIVKVKDQHLGGNRLKILDPQRCQGLGH